MPKILESVFTDYDRFKSLPYTQQYDVAMSFYENYIEDDNFRALPQRDRVAYKQGFIQHEIGGSVSGEGTLEGWLGSALRKGLSQVADMESSMVELGASYNPLSLVAPNYTGPFSPEDFASMVDWWDDKAKAALPSRAPTGKYAAPPQTALEHLNPKRWGHAVISHAPLNAMLIASYAANPLAGAALMGVVEGGNTATEFRKAREAGADIPLWQEKGVPIMVGTVNAILEKMLPEYVLKGLSGGPKALLKRGIMSAILEGTTEGLQEIAPLLAEIGALNLELDMADIVDRFHIAIYEGAASGGVFGAVLAPSRMEPQADLRVTEVLPGEPAPSGGVIEDPTTIQYAMDYSKALAHLNSIPLTLEQSDERGTAISRLEDATNSLVRYYMLSHSEDVAGANLEKVMTGLQIPPTAVINKLRGSVIKPTAVSKRVKLPHSLEEGRTFSFQMQTNKGPHNIIVRAHASLKGQTGQRTVERTLTALNINKKRFADIAGRIQDIVVLPSKESEWIEAASNEGAVYAPPNVTDIGRFLAELRKSDIGGEIGALLNQIAKKDGFFIELSNGGYRVLVRGVSNIAGEAAKTPQYAQIIGHEIGHARRAAQREKPATDMSAEELEAARAAEEPAAEAEEIATLKYTEKMTTMHQDILFSVRNSKEAYSPTYTAQQLIKLMNTAGVGGAFSGVRLARGRLFMPVPDANGKIAFEDVNAFVDPASRELWISEDADLGSVGHELTELVANTLGWDSKIVRQGIEIFDGDKEALMDAVGQYFENRIEDKSFLQKLGEWLKELWTEFNRLRGAQLAEQDIIALLNSRIKSKRYFASSAEVMVLQDRRAAAARLAEAWERRARELPIDSAERERATQTATEFRAIESELNGQLESALNPLFSKRKKRLGKTAAEIFDKEVEYPDLTGMVEQQAEVKPKQHDGLEEALMPEVEELIRSRKARRGTARVYWGDKDYANKKTVQNLLSMAPEDIRANMNKILQQVPGGKFARYYPGDYQVEVVQKAAGAALDLEEIDRISRRLERNEQLEPWEARALIMAYSGTAINMMRQMRLEDEGSALWNALRDEFNRANLNLDAAKVKAGWAVAGFDIRDQMENWYPVEMVRMAFGGKVKPAHREELQEIMDLYSQGEVVEAIKKFDTFQAKTQSLPAKIRDLLYAIMYEGLLAPVAFGKNLASNAVWLEMNAGLRAGQAGMDRALQSGMLQKIFPHLSAREQQIYLPEWKIMHDIIWSKAARKRAMANVKRVWREGSVPRDLGYLHTKWELEIGNIGRPFRALGLPDVFARGATLFSHGMMLTDVWFKSLAFDAEIEIQTQNKMRETGLTRSEINDILYRYRQVVYEKKKNIDITSAESKLAGEIMKSAQDFAGYVTFMDSPGPLATSAYALRNFIPGGRAVIPFVNTLCNILQRGLEFTPGVGVAFGARTVQAEKSAITKAREKAQEAIEGPVEPLVPVRWTDTKAGVRLATMQVAGTLATFALYSMLFRPDGEDDIITGGVPRTPRERAEFYATKKPYSIKIGGHWVSYRDFEPINVWLSNICEFRDALKPVEGEEEDAWVVRASNAFGRAVSGVVANVFESTYMDNITQLFDQGLNVSVLGRIPANFVPYSAFMRRAARSYQIMDTGGYTVYENNNLFSAMANILPFTSEEGNWLKKQTRITALGEELTVQVAPASSMTGRFLQTMSQWLPGQIADVYTDPVEEELFKLQVYPGLPQKTMQIRNQEVEFDDGFYREYALLYGKYTKEAIITAMQAEGYEELSNDSRRRLLSRRVDRARDRARRAGRAAWLASHPPQAARTL